MVIDNFLSEELAKDMRQQALAAEYIDWHGPDGQVYKRISQLDNKDICDSIAKHCGKVEMLGMAFRANMNGEPPNQAIHTDVGWGTHALVYYLSDGNSGTAFWKHRATGMTNLSPIDNKTFIKVRKDWADISKWEQIDFVPMKFNRAVMYDSTLFHSRYPFEAFGTCLEDCRLVLVAFFTPESSNG